MRLRRIVIAGVAIALAGTAAYVGNYFYQRESRLSPAHPEALAALAPSDRVDVTSGDWFVFSPTGQPPTKGFIFYPGGECDERGYAELMHAIAAEGFLVVLVPMPLQLAVLAPDRAEAVMAAFPEIESWSIGGHSLGGAMAARFVYTHPDAMAGLLFWDAYPPDTDDLSDRTLRVRLIHRADDTGQPPEYYAKYRSLLPADMEYSAIRGGNHINFGHFVPAARFADDLASATITLDIQHQQLVSYTVEFLNGV